MNLSFWHDMDWFGWIGVALIFSGLVLSWTRWIQASMACVAFGTTNLGLELLAMRLDPAHVFGAMFMFLWAAGVIVIAAWKARADQREAAGNEPSAKG